MSSTHLRKNELIHDEDWFVHHQESTNRLSDRTKLIDAEFAKITDKFEATSEAVRKIATSVDWDKLAVKDLYFNPANSEVTPIKKASKPQTKSPIGEW